MAKNQGSDGNIYHFGAVRLRIVGSGNLLQYLRSLQNDKYVEIASQTLVPVTSREPLTNSNFSNQRAQYELRTINIDEYFVVSKMVIFIKTLATGYPQ